MKIRKMKREIKFIIGILITAAILGLLCIVIQQKDGAVLRITVDQVEYGVYSLDENKTIRIGNTNVCIIEDGKVSMIEGECPDQICVHSEPIHKNGQSIICMPNKVVLMIDSETAGDVDIMAE